MYIIEGKESMRRIFVLSVLLMAILLPFLITSAPVSASTIFSDIFSPQQPGWSFQSPSPGFLGELNNNVNVANVTLTIDVPNAVSDASLEFDLLAIRTLDGISCCTDTLTLTINGAVAFTAAFHGLIPERSTFFTNPAGATFSTPDGGFHYHVVVPTHLLAGTNTFNWSYTPLQSFDDEAWGLDNVLIKTQCSDIDSDTDGIQDCLDGGRYPNGSDPLGMFDADEFVSQSNVFSSTFTDQEVGGKTGGIVFDSAIGQTGRRIHPFIPAVSENFGVGRRGTTIDSIVIHHCADTFTGCIKTFRTASEEKSAHYVISKKGEVVQMVNDLDRAFHAQYYNCRSIGIELEGFGRPGDYTPAMYESLAGLIAVLLERHPTIPLAFPSEEATLNQTNGQITCLDVPGIIGHRQIQPSPGPYVCTPSDSCRPSETLEKKKDPSDNFSWPLLRVLISLKRLDLLAGPTIAVKDIDAEGVLIEASGGSGGAAAVAPFCNIGSVTGLASLRLTTGDAVAMTCSSLTARVLSGPVEIVIAHDTIVTVPNSTSVTVIEVRQGELELKNSAGSRDIIVISADGLRLQLAPGESAVQRIPQEVTIDLKPDSEANSLNPESKGVIPVAILSTGDFDATTVDPLSVRFGPSGAAEAHGRGHIEDVDNDGDNDLILHFDSQATGIHCGNTSASLRGNTLSGQLIRGIDVITTVGCK
jgi:N-acetyl-anhydromuramyl-L-alanine amidase AmpD